MTTLQLLENPRRKHRRVRRRKSTTVRVRHRVRRNPRRRRSTKRRFLMIPLKRRSMTKTNEGATTMSHKRRTRRHRRFHRNPPFNVKGVVGNIGGKFQDAAVGAGGIVVTGLVTDLVAKPLNVTDPKMKSLVALGVALFGLPALGSVTKMPLFTRAAGAAGAVALLNAVKQYIPGIPGLSGIGTEFALPVDSQVPTRLLAGDGDRSDSVPAPLYG